LREGKTAFITQYDEDEALSAGGERVIERLRSSHMLQDQECGT